MSLQLPLFAPPSKDWTAPKVFPKLSGVVGLDVETCDPHLLELGPGGVRKDGKLVGISISMPGFLGYYPIDHMGGGNVNKQEVLKWLRAELRNPALTIVGANVLYDVEWLSTEHVEVAGTLIDVCAVEALIEEEAGEGFSLDKLSRKYLGKPKEETLLREAAQLFGVDPKSGLWKLPAVYVGAYAEWDAEAARLIYEKQLIEIACQGLGDILKLEVELTPLLWKMRRQGVRIDMEASAKLGGELILEENQLFRDIESQIGWRPDVWSSRSLDKLFAQLQEWHPSTGKGASSYTKDFLSHHANKTIQLVSKIREINRLRETFVRDWSSKYVIGDRAYPSWRQLASDEGGTRTGRMASANPNMQQIPSRAEIASDIRALFIPEVGKRWMKLDYSQQEPRLLVHYAATFHKYGVNMPGALEVRDAYRNDPRMDIYAMLGTMGNISRRHAKGATLGRMYGMGARKYAQQQGVTEEEGTRILSEFDQRVPFVRILSDRCANLAETRGWIRTLGGRRRHFNLWEPRYSERERTPYPLETARLKYPDEGLRRAGTRKALNALIQGSAADMTKRAMVLLYKHSGLVPTLVVHDELDVCIETEDQMALCKKIAEEAYTLQVPVIADCKLGDHWS